MTDETGMHSQQQKGVNTFMQKAYQVSGVINLIFAMAIVVLGVFGPKSIPMLYGYIESKFEDARLAGRVAAVEQWQKDWPLTGELKTDRDQNNKLLRLRREVDEMLKFHPRQE